MRDYLANSWPPGCVSGELPFGHGRVIRVGEPIIVGALDRGAFPA